MRNAVTKAHRRRDEIYGCCDPLDRVLLEVSGGVAIRVPFEKKEASLDGFSMPSAKRPFPYAASGTIALGPIGRQFPNGFSSPFSRRLAELALESTGERRRRSETRAFGNEFDRPIAVGE